MKMLLLWIPLAALAHLHKLKVIKKGSNFRSAPKIVDLLNEIRPDLPQTSAIDDFKGEVFVITCEDYTGPRRADRNFKNELPPEELKSRLNKVTEKIKQETPAGEELKVLMITHKVLATQQGYEKLLDILNDGLRDKEDPFLLFFMETVEPIYHALNTSDMQLLFDTLGIKRYPITKKAEKNKWKELQRQLDEARKKRAIDVFEIINRTKLIPIPPKLDGWYHLYQNTPETIYASNTSIEAFLNLDYAQFIAVKDFLHPEARYSTEHGVKGEEYDNVIFVISKGWNQYQFETYGNRQPGHRHCSGYAGGAGAAGRREAHWQCQRKAGALYGADLCGAGSGCGAAQPAASSGGVHLHCGGGVQPGGLYRRRSGQLVPEHAERCFPRNIFQRSGPWHRLHCPCLR